MKTKHALPVLLLSLVILTVSCAQKEVFVDDTSLKPLNSMKDLLIHVEGEPQLNIGSVVDERPQTESLGRVGSGMFDEQVPLKTSVPVADFVRSRFVSGLAARGFDVKSNAPYTLKLRIRKLWVSEIAPGKEVEKANCDLELDYELIDQKTNKSRVTGSVSSEASGTNSILSATKSVGPVVESCLGIAMNYMIQQRNFADLLGVRIQPK